MNTSVSGDIRPTRLPDFPVTRMLFDGVGKPFRLENRRASFAPGAGEVLVEITLASVCGSDLHTVGGRRPTYLPSVLGHEGVGVVTAVGAGRDASLVGKRVTWTLTDTCGCCRPCTDWKIPQKCDHLFKYGHAPLDDGQGLNGCFASHILLRKGTAVVVLPASVSDAVAVPANCALATMVAVVNKVPGDAKRVLIQGAGLLGVYGAALLKHRGAEEIWISDTVDGRLQLAAEFGAKPVRGQEVAKFKDKSFDAVIEVAGVSAIIPEGIRLLRPAGTYIFAGMVHPETKLDITGLDIIKGCLTVIGVHNYAAHDLTEGVNFLAETGAVFPWEKLVSPPVPLARLDEAFDLTNKRLWHRVSVKP